MVMGSLSVLALINERAIPDAMTVSAEVDAYPESDPGRAFEIADDFGLGSEFEQRNGYYYDAVSPALPTLPRGWEQRLIPLALPGGNAGQVHRAPRRGHRQAFARRAQGHAMDPCRDRRVDPVGRDTRVPLQGNGVCRRSRARKGARRDREGDEEGGIQAARVGAEVDAPSGKPRLADYQPYWD